MSGSTLTLLGSIKSVEMTLGTEIQEVQSSLRSAELTIGNGLAEIQSSVGKLGDQLSNVFTWGFSEMLASMGGMQTTLDGLLKTASTPLQVAAYEHFDIARDCFQKGLLPECLGSLDQAINGVSGVSAGYKPEWRFHQLRGLLLLGSYESSDLNLVNPAEAEKSFLNAGRYAAAAKFQMDAAKAYLSAGWAAYVQMDQLGSEKLQHALKHTQRAIELDPNLCEAIFQEAKFKMAMGLPTEALVSLRKTLEHGAVYLIKAAADGDFRRHSFEFCSFLEGLRQETSENLRRGLGPVITKIQAVQAVIPKFREDSVAQRVFEYGSSPDTKGLLELMEYFSNQCSKDQNDLKSRYFECFRTKVREWEETVIEEVSTGESAKVQVIVPETYWEEVTEHGTETYLEEVTQQVTETYWEEQVQPGGWFRKEIRTKVQKTRPKEVRIQVQKTRPKEVWIRVRKERSQVVIREEPIIHRVEKRITRRTEIHHPVFMNGLGEELNLPIDFPIVQIPTGVFIMGGLKEEAQRLDETQHEVTLTRPFFLAVHPCTQQQWESVMGSCPSVFKGADRPVETINWEEAVEFCRRLTEKHRGQGVLSEGWAWRLPTEAEWEYAARAGTTGARYGELDAIAWHYGNSGKTTHAVKGKQANAWGLYDMIGNVQEWCSDWYGDYSTAPVTDPLGPNLGSYRVTRGGSWSIGDWNARSAFRDGRRPGERYFFLGFRPALSLVR
jgi:formylglycine-generating enzyme required for sulfatase activity